VCSRTSEAARAGLGSEEALLHLEAKPSCPLRYIGPYKVTQVAGLKVAVFDDARAATNKALLSELASSEGDIDLLLTCSWPQDITTGAEAVDGVPHISALQT
jgi:hypothetical protein